MRSRLHGHFPASCGKNNVWFRGHMGLILSLLSTSGQIGGREFLNLSDSAEQMLFLAFRTQTDPLPET